MASLTGALGVEWATVLAAPHVMQGGSVGLSVRVPIAAADFDTSVRQRFCACLVATAGLLLAQVKQTE